MLLRGVATAMSHMKRFYTLLMLAGALTAGAYTVREYKASTAVPLNVPALPDSIQKENPFKADQLLKSRHFATQWPETAGWTTMEADTAGQLRLVRPSGVPELQTLSTRMRASRFAKGKLLLKSAPRAEVYVNGISKIIKTTADSLPAEASAQIELLPEADNSILVNVLMMPDDKGEPALSLEFVPDDDFKDVSVEASPLLRRRVGPLSTMLGERVYANDISADGTYLLTKYRETVDANTTEYRAVVTETASGKVISEAVNRSASWMPRSHKLYYTKKGTKDYDLYTVDVPSMKVQKIASAIPEENVTIAPNEDYLIYYKTVEGAKEDGIMRRVKTPDDRIPGDRDRYYLAKYDLKNGVETLLTYGGSSSYVLDFNRDGSKMLFSSSTATPAKYPFSVISIIQMDMTTYACDTIISNADGFISNAVYSPDARQLFIMAGPDAFEGIGANYGPHEIGNSFDNQGFIMDIATRKVRPVTRDFDPALESAVWNPVTNKIYLRAERGFFNDVYMLDPVSGKISRMATDVENVRGFSIGDSENRWMAYFGGGFTQDGAAYVMDLKTGKSRLVDAPLDLWLGDTEFGKMEPWKFTASDGTEIDGYMCLPPGFDASKKYPLIVYYYGGTSPTNASFYHLYSPQVFASRGYVVYTLNPSGTTGYGQEFSARHVNAWGKRTAEDIIEGVKKFCAVHPFVDSKKIGCLGASYGGFMTQYLLTKTDIFAAAMSHAGISNVTSYWGEGYWGYSYNSVAAAKSYPWSNPDLFTKQGSLFNADKIHTPLLLLHGTVDTNVPIGESIQLFNALKILGRDVEFITVQDENHVISKFDNKLAWQNTIMAWFAKWLQDDPRWWNELYGK